MHRIQRPIAGLAVVGTDGKFSYNIVNRLGDHVPETVEHQAIVVGVYRII